MTAVEGSTITVIIDKQGNSKISVKGVKGKACKLLTQNLESEIGDVVSSTPTAEMREEPQETVNARNRY